MSHRERSKNDTGRSRSVKARDRAQMCFDDLLIDEYLSDEDALDIHEREVVKVRYGVQRLADHLSDSTIACHVLGLGDDAPNDGDAMELNVIGDHAQLLMEPRKNQTTTEPPSASINDEANIDSDRFSLSGILCGMAYGTAAGLGILFILGLFV